MSDNWTFALIIVAAAACFFRLASCMDVRPTRSDCMKAYPELRVGVSP